MNKFFRHLGKVIKHKNMVFRMCLKCGLFWRGLVHDMSKFAPTELFESVKYYTDGKGSPISECRSKIGHSYAWIHHIHKNKHHAEYWLDIYNDHQCNMPYKYAVESICDKISASKCYNGKNYKPHMVLDYWLNNEINLPMNENMKTFYTKVLTDLAEQGEKFILNKKYLKRMYDAIVVKLDNIKD